MPGTTTLRGQRGLFVSALLVIIGLASYVGWNVLVVAAMALVMVETRA